MGKPVSRRTLWLQKLAGEVIHDITEQIRGGVLQPGERLSLEALAADHVTSLSVVERALSDMAEAGTLVRDGEGFRIAPDPGTSSEFAVPDDASDRIEDILAILELRMGLEAEGAALAAERRSAEDMAEIEAAAQAYVEAVHKNEGTGRADFRLHRAIAAASGNPYLLDLFDHLGPLLIPRMRVRISPSTEPKSPARRSMAEHDSLVAAIRAMDAVAARGAMQAHLKRTIELIRSLGTE